MTFAHMVPLRLKQNKAIILLAADKIGNELRTEIDKLQQGMLNQTETPTSIGGVP